MKDVVVRIYTNKGWTKAFGLLFDDDEEIIKVEVLYDEEIKTTTSSKVR